MLDLVNPLGGDDDKLGAMIRRHRAVTWRRAVQDFQTLPGHGSHQLYLGSVSRRHPLRFRCSKIDDGGVWQCWSMPFDDEWRKQWRTRYPVHPSELSLMRHPRALVLDVRLHIDQAGRPLLEFAVVRCRQNANTFAEVYATGAIACCDDLADGLYLQLDGSPTHRLDTDDIDAAVTVRQKARNLAGEELDAEEGAIIYALRRPGSPLGRHHQLQVELMAAGLETSIEINLLRLIGIRAPAQP